MPDWVEITTLNQLFFHLDRGEVVAWRAADADVFLQAEGNGYRVIIQPPFRSAVELLGGKEQVEKMFAEFKPAGVRFWVCPGAELCRDDRFLVRLLSGFRWLLGRFFG